MIILAGTSLPVNVNTEPLERRGIRPDRVVHLILYGSLQVALLRGIGGAALSALPKHHIFAFLSTVGFGLADELHQIPVPSRDFEWSDIFFDALGAALASGIVLFSRRKGRPA